MNILKLIAGFALLAGAVVSAANAPVSTTLESRLGREANQLVLASTTGLVAGDQLYIDRELMTIQRINGKLITVFRTKPVPHNAASTVTGGNSRFFTDQPRSGACEAADTYDVIQIDNGVVWSCAGVGSSWASSGGGTLPAGWGATGTAMHKGGTGTRPTECDPANITAGLFCFWFDSTAKAIKTMNEDGVSVTLGAGGGGVSVGAVGAGGASAPACGTSGFIYKGTDSAYVGYCDGASSYHWNWGALSEVSLPTSAQTSWINQGSATLTGTTNLLLKAASSGAGTNAQGRYQAIPSAPYTVSACFVPLTPDWDGTGQPSMGIFLGNGTATGGASHYEMFFLRPDNSGGLSLHGFHTIDFGISGGMNGGAIFTDGSVTAAKQAANAPTCLAISNDGTNQKFASSADNQTWVVAASEAKASFLTATHIGYFVDAYTTTSLAPAMQLVSWKVSTSALF